MAKKVKKKIKKQSTNKNVKKISAKKSAKKSVKKKVVVKKAQKKAVKKITKKKSAKKKTSRKAPAIPKNSPVKKMTRRIIKRKDNNLSPKDLLYFRELLIEKLKEITGDVNHLETESLQKSRLDATGDLSSMPIHMADIGSDNYEQEFALGLMDSERKIVHDIYLALKRIEDGTYGVCEGNEELIPRLRLEGIPWARYCIQCQEMIEKGILSEMEPLEYESEENDSELDNEGFEDLTNSPLLEDDDDEDEQEEDYYGYDVEEEDF